jgi:hypothetical protein
MRGSDDLRDWLTSAGFRCAPDSLASTTNDCNWYAYRPSLLSARPCECNDGKRLQIVVRPHAFTSNGTTHESASVDITGEAGGLWFTQSAYSLSHATIKCRLSEIETMLISAWNSLLIPANKNN